MALVEKKVVRRKKAIAQEAKGKAFTAKETKVKKDARAKKKQKIPPGGISLGSSSTTTWKQTPTSKAVDDRKHKKEWRAWAKGGHKGSQPIRPAWVGATATTKRRTKYKTDAKGGKTTRSVTDFRGPGGMIPEHLKMARPTPKSKPKKRVIGHEKTSTWSGKASDVRKPTVKRKKIYNN